MDLPNLNESVSYPIGDRLRRIRTSRGMSLRKLAHDVGVSPATISMIETGKTRLSVTRLLQIAAVLEVPSSALLEEETLNQMAPDPVASAAVGAGGDWRTFDPLPIDQVLAGAVRAFVATGYHGATMRLIAEFAGMSVPGVYHHYRSKQELLVSVLDITMMDLIWRVKQASSEGRCPAEKVALVVEALALFHTRRSALAFIGASEMRSLEPASYRRIAALRDQVQHLLDQEIASATAAGALSLEFARYAGKAIATMCTALPQWFRPDGPTSPEQIAKGYAHLALRLLGGSPFDGELPPASLSLPHQSPAHS